MHLMLRAALALAVLATASPSAARDLYRSIVTVGGSTVVRTTNSLKDLEELYEDASLSAIFPGYVSGVSAVNAAVDLRGLDTSISYAANSPALRFVVEAAGIDVTFNGATRDESEEMFEDWLKGRNVPGVSSSLVTDLLQALVAESPVDPVAGNPHSLESRMFEGDFAIGTLGAFLKDFPDASQRIPSVFKVDAEFGQFYAGPYSGQIYDLEFGAAWSLTRRLVLLTDLEMLFSVTEGDATSGHGHLGLGLQGRILDWWNVALVGRIGLVGSIDVGAVAMMYTISAVNHMRFDFDEYRVDMKNQLGIANTVSSIEVKGIELDYDLTNVSLKNGLELSRAIPVAGWPRELRGRLFWTNSLYFVDDLWLEHSNEVGVGIGLASKSGVLAYDPITLDVSYVGGSSYDAVKLNLSLRY